jgi:hypothetical protein
MPRFKTTGPEHTYGCFERCCHLSFKLEDRAKCGEKCIQYRERKTRIEAMR